MACAAAQRDSGSGEGVGFGLLEPRARDAEAFFREGGALEAGRTRRERDALADGLAERVREALSLGRPVREAVGQARRVGLQRLGQIRLRRGGSTGRGHVGLAIRPLATGG